MAGFQSGAREELRYVRTDERDVSSGTDYQIIPHSGNMTGPHKPGNRGPTDEVRADLRVGDNPLRGFTVPFQFGGVWRYGIYDDLIEMMLGGLFSSAVSIADTDIASDATGNKFTSATTDKFNDLSADVPCLVWIKRDGATPLSTLAVAISVVEGASPELVIGTGVAGADFGKTLTVEAAGDNVTIMHSGVVTEGVLELYAMLERAQLGVGHFHVGFGCIATQMDLNQQKGQDPTFGMQFMGVDHDSATTTFGTGTEIPAGTFNAFNAGSDIKFFGEDGEFSTAFTAASDLELFVNTINLAIACAAPAVDPMGIDGEYSHGRDTITPSGRFTLYTNDDARLVAAKQEGNVDSSLIWMNQKTVGGVTKAYGHWLPHIQYESADHEGGGKGGILTRPLTWRARISETHGLMYSLTRFDGLPL